MTRRTTAVVTSAISGLALVAGALVVTDDPAPAEAATPSISTTVVVGNLAVPWDLTWVGGTLLFDQRAGGVWAKRGTVAPRRVTMALPPIFHSSEAGMLGMVADPSAATNRTFYTCLAVATASGKAKDVEVWK